QGAGGEDVWASGTGEGDDPFADLANGRGGGMTAAERRAQLEARLEESYGEFDGMILSERERILGQANASGSGVMSGQRGEGEGEGQGSRGDWGEPGGLPGGIVIASAPDSSSGAGHMPSGGAGRQGEYSGQAQPRYPVPGDIPSGND